VGDRDLVPVRPGTQLAARVGLWSLVVVGFVGGVAGLLRPSQSAPLRVQDTENQRTIASPDVAGFAEFAVGKWLEVDDETASRAAALFVEEPRDPGPDATTRQVGRLTAVRTRRIDAGYWAVTVAAEVVEQSRETGELPAAPWYVEIGVVLGRQGSLAAAGTPAIVAPPPTKPRGVAIEDSWREVQGMDDPVATTVGGFLTGLLTGTGDVSRYLAPGVVLAPANPAPFVGVQVEHVGISDLDEAALRVQVAAIGTTPAGGLQATSYELTMAQRAGRWEIRAMSGAPTLRATDEAPAPSTTAPEQQTTSTSVAAVPGA
jgi:Conjugative transposon protein TcpC